jgi:two-component system, OmpR family, phosphate regulon response regulator PhoB
MKTVLLVEDDAVLGKSFELTLVAAGYRVVRATSAQEAMDVVDDGKIDVIVLDMFLPGANGLQLLHEIRSYEDTASIPVVMCSANAEGFDKRSLAAYGVLTVLAKSDLTPGSLRQAVADVVT